MRRPGIRIMGSLIGLTAPLLPFMGAAVLMGTAGYLCAIGITVAASAGVLLLLGPGRELPAFFPGTLSGFCVLLGVLAVLRGVLHYVEQDCNHYIAFRLLAVLRHKVFAALRRLAPARLEGKDRGNLISVITSDIELLEVFYAHTISPVAIAVLTSLIMAGFIGSFAPVCGALAVLGYVTVGAVLPLWNAGRGGAVGVEYREAFGEMNSFLLDSLRGIREIIQYGRTGERLSELSAGSGRLAARQKKLTFLQGDASAVTGICITGFSFAMLFLALHLYGAAGGSAAAAVPGTGMTFSGAVLVTVAMMSSFGPVTALSSLSNNLNQTLACGERVLRVLEEEPETEEVEGAEPLSAGAPDAAASAQDGRCPCAELSHVSFSYDAEPVLKDVSLAVPSGRILGIYGRSGSGKSTILKLLMRFWDADGGKVSVCGRDVRGINTADLRGAEALVTQETVLFRDTIAANIGIGRPGAGREEIVEAAGKASLHGFVSSLPQGYDTPVAELGDSLSGGERQRIGLARAFLHRAPFLLLDEPTSNLDSLNEGIILKALYEERKERTVVLVSHRKSTMGICDELYEMDEGRMS